MNQYEPFGYAPGKIRDDSGTATPHFAPLHAGYDWAVSGELAELSNHQVWLEMLIKLPRHSMLKNRPVP